MLGIMRRFNLERGFQLNLQIGINSGDVVAGIVGRNKVIYDVWGDTINLASTLKEACPPGAILVSDVVHHRLHDLYQFEVANSMLSSETNGESNGKPKLQAWRLKSTLMPVEAEQRGII
jgi:class 3 adenylate cyclase